MARSMAGLDSRGSASASSLNFKLKPSDYFRRQGYVTYQQDKCLEPIVPLIGEDNIMCGSGHPHPDSLGPESHAGLRENLATLSATVRRKIVFAHRRGIQLRLPRPKLRAPRRQAKKGYSLPR